MSPVPPFGDVSVSGSQGVLDEDPATTDTKPQSRGSCFLGAFGP